MYDFAQFKSFMKMLLMKSISTLKINMGQKKALNGSHLEVFLVPQHNTEHDFDLSISNVFLTFVQLLQEIKKKQKRGYAFKFQIRLKAFLEKFSLKTIN